MNVRLGTLRRGRAGTAREQFFDLDPSEPKDWTATVGTWFIDAPGQSPAWHHYGLSVIHLREIEGAKPPAIREQGATHEFLLVALDPAKNPDPMDPKTWSFLRPYNLCEQVTIADDLTANKILHACAAAVVDGRLWAEAPLSGQVEPWRATLRHWAANPSHATL